MSVLPFPSFLDDIKEKGFKKAVFEGVNDVTERLTAGLNLQDIREVLRGEQPSRRPNPRLQPHADGFWLHMRPSYFHRDMTGLYPTFRLGWLSTYFVAFETITGIFLMIFYTPSPEVAYSNMINILSNVPLGQFMRDLHRLGAEAMVLIVTLHMVRTFVTGSYKRPRQFTWFTGVILLLATLFLSFSGYLLPWDQLALWAVTIGASMVEAAPPEVVGQNLNLLLRGGPDIGANGLLRFYLLHVLAVPAILVIFTGVHYYKVVIHGHSLPPQKENIGEDTAKRVPLDKRVYFIPDVLTSELMWIGVSTLIMIVLVTWFYAAPLEAHADPQVTPLGTTAPWYFLWIQGALKLGDKFIWGILFPTLVFGFMMAYPYLDLNPSRRFKDRRFALTILCVFISATTVLSYMGLAEYGVSTAADAEIIHEMVKEPAHNHMGVLLPVPFEEMVVGAYTTAQFHGDDPEVAVAEFNARLEETEEGQALLDLLRTQHNTMQAITFDVVPSSSPELLHAMEQFNEWIEEDANSLPDSWGAVIITQRQDDLKRLDVVLSWDRVELDGTFPVLDETGEPVRVVDEETGEPERRINGEYIYIHENSEYYD